MTINPKPTFQLGARVSAEESCERAGGMPKRRQTQCAWKSGGVRSLSRADQSRGIPTARPVAVGSGLLIRSCPPGSENETRGTDPGRVVRRHRARDLGRATTRDLIAANAERSRQGRWAAAARIGNRALRPRSRPLLTEIRQQVSECVQRIPRSMLDRCKLSRAAACRGQVSRRRHSKAFIVQRLFIVRITGGFRISSNAFIVRWREPVTAVECAPKRGRLALALPWIDALCIVEVAV
jgi:hypothetical protein